jgi:Ras-related GTP-binding protein A/B
VPQDQREKVREQLIIRAVIFTLHIQVFIARRDQVAEMAKPFKAQCFMTSIWEESLYKAWSQIVYAMIPNGPLLQNNLEAFCEATEVEEVVLFEKVRLVRLSSDSPSTGDISGHFTRHTQAQ